MFGLFIAVLTASTVAEAQKQQPEAETKPAIVAEAQEPNSAPAKAEEGTAGHQDPAGGANPGPETAAESAAAPLPQKTNKLHSDYKLQSLPATGARQLILQDVSSGAILLEKNPDEQMAPSSMTKMVTASVIADKVQSGQIALDTRFIVSKNAYNREGSSMFLKQGQKVSVQDLLTGLIVVSGNDAAVALAEGASGSEAAFAEEMTAFARASGAVNTHFVNAHGLPHPDHWTTARDLLRIARRILQEYPYELYSQKEFTFNGVHQVSRNVLLQRDIGCDGIKTGNTSAGGFGITASCAQGGRRLVLVANGYQSAGERADNAELLLTWGMKAFVNRKLYSANKLIIQVPVWYGEESYVPVTVDADVVVTLPRAAQKDLRVLLCYNTPVSAPVQKGAPIGEIQISSAAFRKPMIVPLVASVDIREAGFFKKVKDSLLYLVWGIRKPEVPHEGE